MACLIIINDLLYCNLIRLIKIFPIIQECCLQSFDILSASFFFFFSSHLSSLSWNLCKLLFYLAKVFFFLPVLFCQKTNFKLIFKNPSITSIVWWINGCNFKSMVFMNVLRVTVTTNRSNHWNRVAAQHS
jgi:hypothetical protein